MSTYLLAWAVGEFDYIQAVTKGKLLDKSDMRIKCIIKGKEGKLYSY